MFSSLVIGDHSRLWLSCLGHLVLLFPKTFILFTLQFFDIGGDSRNTSRALNLISTFLFVTRIRLFSQMLILILRTIYLCIGSRFPIGERSDFIWIKHTTINDCCHRWLFSSVKWTVFSYIHDQNELISNRAYISQINKLLKVQSSWFHCLSLFSSLHIHDCVFYRNMVWTLTHLYNIFQKRCREIGGYLVKVDNDAENNWIASRKAKCII